MKPKALIIDDNKGDIALVEEYFNEEGLAYEILTAESGEQGLTIAWMQKPEVIFLDINMPGLDGFDVCRQLKSSGAEKVHIIIMTGDTNPEAEKAIKKLGADDFCIKTPGALYEKLMRYYHIDRKAKK